MMKRGEKLIRLALKAQQKDNVGNMEHETGKKRKDRKLLKIILEAKQKDGSIGDDPIKDVSIEDVPINDSSIEVVPINDSCIENVPIINDGSIEDTCIKDGSFEDSPVEDGMEKHTIFATGTMDGEDDNDHDTYTDFSDSGDSYKPDEGDTETDDEKVSDGIDLEEVVITTFEPEVAEVGTRRKRKRIADPSKWKKNIRKTKRQCGESYINRNNKIVPARNPRYVDCTKCRFKCSEISPQRQDIIFKEYWDLQDVWKQKSMLCSLITVNPVFRKRKRQLHSNREKKSSRYYHLIDENGSEKRVCLRFFCGVFDISFPVIDNALANIGESGSYVGTNKKKGKRPPNATSQEAENLVRQHIDSFPRLPSHYCRRDSNKLYLCPTLNLCEMYRLYKNSFCSEKSLDPVSEAVYRRIFNSYEPQLSFYIPKKDQCTKCNSFRENAAVKNEKETQDYNEHISRKEIAMKMKEVDNKEAREAKGISKRSISFDLQAILTVPFAGDAQIFYKRKLSVYNFTIFDASNSEGICYMWDETHGGKGASEIGTCLLQYLQQLPESVQHVTSYSDTCGGQNRNQFVATAMLYCVSKNNIKIIDMKFMEPGHSYLEADSIHATIERARKHRKIYTPGEWAILIQMSRNKPRPYRVKTMNFTDFYDLQELNRKTVINTKVNSKNEPINWFSIKWLRFEKEKPFTIQYKNDLNDPDFEEINIAEMRRKKKGFSWNSIELVNKYSRRIPISEAKKNDLMSLLNTGVIPNQYQEFVKNIPSTKNIADTASWIVDEN